MATHLARSAAFLASRGAPLALDESGWRQLRQLEWTRRALDQACNDLVRQGGLTLIPMPDLVEIELREGSLSMGYLNAPLEAIEGTR